MFIAGNSTSITINNFLFKSIRCKFLKKIKKKVNNKSYATFFLR